MFESTAFMPSVHKLYANGRKALNPSEQWIVLGENTPQDVASSVCFNPGQSTAPRDLMLNKIPG